jgi:cytosine/adenosine deaminase-related metal-dependent hydrolase
MRFLRADHIFSGEKFLATDTVLVINENGLIQDFTTADKVEETVIEHFNGIICPGFVNAHCHLELSHLQNVIKEHTGIVDFALPCKHNTTNLS